MRIDPKKRIEISKNLLIFHAIFHDFYGGFGFLEAAHFEARKVLRRANHVKESNKILVCFPREVCLSPHDAAYHKTILLATRNSRDGADGRISNDLRETPITENFGKLLFTLTHPRPCHTLSTWWDRVTRCCVTKNCLVLRARHANIVRAYT